MATGGPDKKDKGGLPKRRRKGKRPSLTALVMAAAIVAAIVALFQIFGEKPPPGPTAPETARAPTEESAVAEPSKPAPVTWRMASTYAGDLPYFGTLGKRLSQRVGAATDGALAVTFFEPDVLLPPLTGFGAVAEGRIDAVWGTAAYWVDEVPTAPWFSGMPFGLDGAEHRTWLTEGGGQALWDQAYAAAGVKGIACGVAPADGGGWFRKQIRKVSDVKRLKMRIYGYGAPVMENLGATIVQATAPELYDAFESGELDGAEFSIPSIDVKLELGDVAPYYYQPGWHQPVTVLELLVNRSAFNALDGDTRGILLAVCADNYRQGLRDAETSETAALKQMETEGVKVRTLPDPVLTALRQSWNQISAAKSLDDPEFRRIAESVADFRARRSVPQPTSGTN
jgi:TRAP-type mannitol/chloroaromatic compound transport system substrate-binding protein